MESIPVNKMVEHVSFLLAAIGSVFAIGWEGGLWGMGEYVGRGVGGWGGEGGVVQAKG